MPAKAGIQSNQKQFLGHRPRTKDALGRLRRDTAKPPGLGHNHTQILGK
jgi:hypothetical protein